MSSASIQHNYIKVNGIRLHYVEAGEGQPLILLHGFPEFWYSWRKQIPALAEHYRIIVPNMRGYNLSDKPKGVAHYKPSIVTEDIRQFIHKVTDGQATLIAHDWGGAIALNLAEQHPELLDKLIIMNTAHPQLLLKTFITNFTQLKKSWYMFFFQLPGLPEHYIGKALPAFFKKAFRGWAHRQDAFTDEDIQAYVDVFSQPYALTAAINYYRAAFREAPSRLMAKSHQIQADTLAIWGEDDRALDPILLKRMRNDFANRFEVHAIPNCSHWVQQEYPDEVNRAIIDFLVGAKTEMNSA